MRLFFLFSFPLQVLAVLALVGACAAFPGGHAESYASVVQHSLPIHISHHEPVAIKHEEEHIILVRAYEIIPANLEFMI